MTKKSKKDWEDDSWIDDIIRAPGGPPPANPGEEPPVQIYFTDEELEERCREWLKSKSDSETA